MNCLVADIIALAAGAAALDLVGRLALCQRYRHRAVDLFGVADRLGHFNDPVQSDIIA